MRRLATFLLALLLAAGWGAELRAEQLAEQLARGEQMARLEQLRPDEFECLALNVYFEAGGESRSGRLAVAWVTLNRWSDSRFPDTLCGVVKQGGEARYRCQFQWWCDGFADIPENPDRWSDARAAARDALTGRRSDPTGGALFFHNGHARPAWRHVKTPTAQIGNHTFYR